MRKKCLQILCAVIFTLVFTVFSLKINNSIENVNGAEIVIDTGFTYNDTEEKYYIKNLEGFKNFVEYANNPDYGFVSSDTIILQSDIDATNENIVPINEWNATFDGDKYTIKGLSMFCKVNNGVIRKVEFVESKTKYIDPWEVRTLEDAHNNIYYAWYDYVNTSDDHYSWYAVGGVAGINYGMIHLCGVVDSTIRLEMDPNIKIHAEQPWPEYHFACVGGISGINFGEVNACYVYGSTITTYDDETYEHYDKQESGELDISRTLLNVGTNNCAGGIVGYLSDLENVSYFENVSQYETQVGELDLCISAKNKVRSYGFSIAERELLERLQSNSAYQNDKANADENLKPSKGYGGLFGASYHEAWSDYKTGVEIFLGLNHGYPLLPASSTRILRCYSADNVALDNRGQTYYPDDPYFDIGSSIKAQNYLIQPYLHDYNNHENNTIFASYSDQKVSYSPVYGLDPENLIYLQLEPRSSMPHGSYIFNYGFEGRDPDKNFYYNVSLQMIKPTSETDHYGYLYIGRDVDVTIQYYNNQNAYNDKSLSSYAPISYTELNDEKLNSSAGLKNLITFTSNGQTYKLKGLKAKRHPDFTETSWNDYVATFDGENFALTGAYSRENAKTYPYVYPEYEVADITLHIKYNSTNYIGKEDLPTLTIKDNDSSIAELNDKTEKVVSVPLGNGISKTYEIDISSLGNSFDENWYYFSARLTAGKSYSSISYNANINGKSDSDGRGLSKPTFDSLSSLVGGFTFNWNVTVNNNNSSDYNLDLYLTITVYKKIRLNVYEDNNMSSCELQWYTLEGTDGLLWGEDSFYDVRNQNYYVNIANSSLYQYQTVYGTYTPGYFATNNYDESQIYDANYNVVGDEGNLYYNIDLKFDAYSQDSGTYAYPSYNLYGKPQSKTGTYTLTIKPNKMGYVTNAHTPSYTVSYIRFYINGVSYSANSIGVSSIYLFESQDLDNGGVSFEFSSSLVLSLSFPDVTSSDYKLSIVKDGTTIIDNVPIRLNYDSSITDEITSIDFNIDAYYNFGYNSLNYDKYILIYNSASKTLSENNIKPISIYHPDYDSVYEEQVIKTENSTTYTTSSGSTATRYGSGARPTTGSNVVMAKRWTMSNTSETEYVNVAELTKLTLNNAVVGSDNTIMYVANGTDVYTQPSIPVGVKSYVYDTSAGTFTIEYPIVFDVCNGQITKFYEHSDSETPYFYYDEAFSYDYPNVTLIAKTYKFYYVQCADTGLTDSNDESMGVSYSDNNDWKIVNTAGTYKGLYEKVSTGSGLGTINRTIDSGLEDRNVYIFVGWTFETSRNATISESTTPLIVATSNTQQVFDNTSFYSQLDSNVDEYFIYEIWKSTTVVSDEVSLTYQVDINKDDNTTQTVNITVGYTFNSAQNLYLPNNSYIDAPGVNGYTFDHWVSISSCDGYVRYLLAGNTASSLQVNNISVSQYYEALNKILTVTAYYTKMPDLPNNMTINLIINKKVNGKSVGTETKTINYTLVDYYYTPTISSINYPNVSNATFQSWYGYDNDTGAMFKNVFNISNSIINVKSLNSLSLSGYSNEYYVDANYRANDTFMLQFDYYSTDGTYLSTENVNFSTTNFTFDKYGTASRTFSSASNLGFPSLKQFDGRTLRFNKIQEVINSPYKGETSYIT